MSYYSDVKCVLKKEDWINIKDAMMSIRDAAINKGFGDEEDVDFAFNKFFTSCESLSVGGTGMIVLIWNSYNNWGRDIATKDFMTYLDENKMYYNYVRIGEGAGDLYEDIEEERNFPYGEEDKYDILEVRKEIKICGR